MPGDALYEQDRRQVEDPDHLCRQQAVQPVQQVAEGTAIDEQADAGQPTARIGGRQDPAADDLCGDAAARGVRPDGPWAVADAGDQGDAGVGGEGFEGLTAGAGRIIELFLG